MQAPPSHSRHSRRRVAGLGRFLLVLALGLCWPLLASAQHTTTLCPPQTASVTAGGTVSIDISACENRAPNGSGIGGLGPIDGGSSGPSDPTNHGTASTRRAIAGDPRSAWILDYTHNGTTGIGSTDVFELTEGSPTGNGDIRFTITINASASPITVLPANLPTLTAGVAFSQTLTASGGLAPYTYQLQGGSLPPGLTLSTGGVLSGIPTQRGSYSFSVRARDATTPTAQFVDRGYGGTVQNPSLSITPTSATAIQGAPFSRAITVNGGVGPYICALETGSFPSGISITTTSTSTGCVIGGTTSVAPGNFPVTLRVTDSSTGPGTYFEVENFTVNVSPPPSVSIAVNPATVDEDGLPTFTYTVTRSLNLASETVVNLSLGGSAVNGTDYVGAPANITIPAGATTATFPIDPVADTTVEPDETVIFSVSSGTGYTIGTSSSATATIRNDDFPTATIAVAPTAVLEDGTPNLVYTVTLSPTPLVSTSVNYSIGGTASNGADYGSIASPVVISAGNPTGTITVNPSADSTNEPDETVTLTLTSGSGYTVGTTNSATGTIQNDDDPCVVFSFPYTLAGADNTARVANLRTAIQCANSNGASADTINLNGQTVTLGDSFADYAGATGLPRVDTPMTLRNGTITRTGSNQFRLLQVGSTGNLTLRNVSLTNGGGATYAGQGALLNASSSSVVTIINSTLSGGVVSNSFNAGGLFASGETTIVNSAISGNQSGRGGGMQLQNGPARIINSVISGNVATSILGGGAMYIVGLDVAVINSTITGNFATASGATRTGGILSDVSGANLTLQNTILWGNFNGDATAPQIVNDSAFGSNTVTNSIVQGGQFGGLNANPLFVTPLPASATPSIAGNFQLGNLSPAIDAGANANVPADTFDVDSDSNTAESTPDLAGNPRRIDDPGVADSGTGTAPIVDLGAYERQISSQPPEVLVSPTSLTLNETGETVGNVVVRLNQMPPTSVTIQLTFDANVQVNAGSGFGASPQTVTLTPANAVTGVTVQVRAVDDAIDEPSPHAGNVTTAATSSATAAFNGLAVPDISVAIFDNDTAGVAVSQSGGSTAVTEGGGGDSYTVVLASQPTADVTVNIAFDAAQVIVNGDTDGATSLVFTAGNWNVAQTVSVSAVDDTLLESNPHTTTLVQGIASADANYNAISPADVTVTITENDLASITLQGAASTVAETAGQANLTARLELISNGAPGGTLSSVLNAQVVLTPGTATQGVDYSQATATVSFPAGSAHNTTLPIAVDVINDRLLEAAETLTVGLVLTSGNGSVSGTHVVTIADDESGVFTFNQASGNAPEAGGTYNRFARLTITGSGIGTTFRIQDAASVALVSTPGTATTPADYTLSTTRLDVPANAGSPLDLTFEAGIVNDAIDEPNETFTIGFGAVTGSGSLQATGTHVVTIVDDDTAGVTLIQTGGSTNVVEGGATDTYTLVLTSQPTANVTITVTPDAQLTASPTGVTFTPGNWNVAQTVTVVAVDDAIVEGPHTGTITHGAASADPGYNGLVVAAVTASITDNDNPGVTITEPGGNTAVTEGGATDTYTLVLTSQPSSNVTVTLSPSAQLTTVPTPLVFSPTNWNVAQTVTVSAVDDGIVEGPHSGTVAHAVASADASYNGLTVAPVAVSITDNDSATVQFAPISVSQSESSSPMAFSVTLSNPVASGVTLTVNSTPGTAIAADFTAITNGTVTFAPNSTTAQTVNVVINNDSLFEGNETYTLALSNLVATGNVTLPPGTATATGTINNDDDAPTITISAPSVTEGNPPTNPPLNFVVSLNTASGLPVSFSFATNGPAGTATAGADYTAITSGVVNIGPGNLSATLPVTVLSDTISEGNETVVLALSGISNANVTTLSGTGTINDDDVAQITITDAGLTESDSGSQNLQFTVNRSGNGGAFSVDFATSNATATAGSDYTSTTGTLNFTANGAPSQVINVPITGESLVEVAETFTVTLSNVVNTLGTAAIDDGSGTGTITDNDSATVQFAPTSVSQSEATSAMAFTVTLSNPVASGVTVTVNSAPGTATSPADFTAISNQTVTFPPNSTTAQTVNVTIANDALDEDDETFTLTLSGLTATGDVTLPAGTATATGTIQDDDALPVLSVANVTQPEGNATNTLTFTVNLSPVSGRTVSLTRATVDGGAVSTGPSPDFVAIPADVVTIPAGQTSLTIPVTINGDTVFEGEEQFTLSLTAVTNATPGSLSATATLTDDDQQPTTTTITADLPDPSVVGQPYPVTVEVRAQTLPPLGTVSINDGTGASCGPVTLTAGTGALSTMSCTLTSTSAGNKTLTATYAPANTAFGASSDTESHRVDPAATTLALAGPATVRFNTPASYTATLAVSGPGAGTPAGIVTVSSGAQSCTITLPTATPSCTLSFPTLGSRTVTAAFVPANGDFLAASSNQVQTLAFASTDLVVSKDNGLTSYQPNDLLVYTVEVENRGPDGAPGVRILDPVPAGLTNVAWTCVAQGGAFCPSAGGAGGLDVVVQTMPSGSRLVYTYYGNVQGSVPEIVNVASVELPANGTLNDPAPGNNSATDIDRLELLFANGFESSPVNGPSGALPLPAIELRGLGGRVAWPLLDIGDRAGLAVRVYVRAIDDSVEYALATRDGDGRLRLGPWQRFPATPTLRWTAEQDRGGWRVTGARLD
jgi:hypothetical protein